MDMVELQTRGVLEKEKDSDGIHKPHSLVKQPSTFKLKLEVPSPGPAILPVTSSTTSRDFPPRLYTDWTSKSLLTTALALVMLKPPTNPSSSRPFQEYIASLPFALGGAVHNLASTAPEFLKVHVIHALVRVQACAGAEE
jgi:hypothetical protein